MVNHFVAASFLRLYFIIFSSAVSLLRKNARKLTPIRLLIILS